MTVNEWLNSNRDYQTGINLYQKHFGNTSLLTLFKAGQNSMSRRKLSEALESFTPVQSDEFELPVPRKYKPDFAMPEPVKLLDELRLESFKKMSALHQTCCNTDGNGPKAVAKRFEMLKQIKELHRVNSECWKKLDYYQEHGRLPVDENEFIPELLTIRQLVNLEKAIPTYISKLKSQLSEIEIPEEKASAINAKIIEWQVQLKAITEIINKLPTLKEVIC